MPSRRLVKETINRAGKHFDACWNILSNLKNQTAERVSILEFQPTLAGALFELEEVRDSINSEMRRLTGRLIVNKQGPSNKWYRHRLKTLDQYQDALRATAQIGRGIGDAFAWIFYYPHREYLRKHLQHQAVATIPVGVGGKGELEFLRQIGGVGNTFAIYHGTTTFLRVGDVSLFDSDSRRFVGLGELKTRRVGPSEIEITVHIISSEEFVATSDGDATHIEPIDVTGFSAAARDRHARQIEEMKRTVKTQKPPKLLDLRGASHIRDFQILARALRRTRVAHQRIGDGLLLIAIRERRKRDLASRLLSRGGGFSDGLSDEVDRKVLEILAPDSQENSVAVGGLDLTLLPGATPLFWWDVDQQLLRSIFFQEIAIVTAYNAIFLVRKLQKAGFRINRVPDSWKFNVSKDVGGPRAVVHGFEYFVYLITNHLMSEDAVVETVSAYIAEVEDSKPPPNARMDMDIQLHWL